MGQQVLGATKEQQTNREQVWLLTQVSWKSSNKADNPKCIATEMFGVTGLDILTTMLLRPCLDTRVRKY